MRLLSQSTERGVTGLEHQYKERLNDTMKMKEEEEEERRREEAEKARRASRMPTYRSNSL
eukprot:3127239-Rhodomonas_salina.2